MKIAALNLITLIIFSTAGAQTVTCSPELLKVVTAKDAFHVCKVESQRLGFQHLPVLIKDKELICSARAPEEQSRCISESLALGKEILICKKNPLRHKQAAEYDIELEQDRLKEFTEVSVPENIQKNFATLTKVTTKHFHFDFESPAWTLRAYQHKIANAHAGAGGNIFLSSALWNPETPYTDGEITAIMAHEVGHVILGHSLKLGCHALEWVGQDIPLKEATEIFREDYSAAIERGAKHSVLSQKYEYEADMIATKLLKLAGFDRKLMAQALQRLKPKSSGGMTSGSHPDFDDRIKAVDFKD